LFPLNLNSVQRRINPLARALSRQSELNAGLGLRWLSDGLTPPVVPCIKLQGGFFSFVHYRLVHFPRKYPYKLKKIDIYLTVS
jgi:hypothetical protein